MRLFCDCKTDEEKSNFFLSGRAFETGIIAYSISNDVAMAYHRCAQFKKENDALRAKVEQLTEAEAVMRRNAFEYQAEAERLRAKIEEMEKQEPVARVWRCDNGHMHGSCERELPISQPLYALPGAKGE